MRRGPGSEPPLHLGSQPHIRVGTPPIPGTSPTDEAASRLSLRISEQAAERAVREQRNAPLVTGRSVQVAATETHDFSASPQVAYWESPFDSNESGEKAPPKPVSTLGGGVVGMTPRLEGPVAVMSHGSFDFRGQPLPEGKAPKVNIL